MKFGVALGKLNPAFFLDVTLEAEHLGFESVWLPEHLVFPIEMAGSPHAEDTHPPVPPQTPVFDAFAYLSFLAGRTEQIKLATHVYNLALRHPFVAARAIQTLDIVSGGRAIAGVGAGWLESEWRAAGLDFKTRGRRLDEALAVCKRLWTEDVIEHHGEFFDFGPVAFDPKPVTKPFPPVLIGGTSDAALRRAARHDGWVGMDASLESIDANIRRLQELRGDASLEITISASPENAADVEAWSAAGAHRLIVSPWKRSPAAVESLRAFAATIGL